MKRRRRPGQVLLLLLLAAVFLFSWQLLSHYFQNQIVEQQEEYLIKKGTLLLHQLNKEDLDSQANEQLLTAYIEHSTERITLLDNHGKILFDTSDPQLQGSRSTRPEVSAILSGSENGSALRESTTLNTELLYDTLPIRFNDQLVGILRIAEPTRGFLPRTEAFRRGLFGLFFLFYVLVTGMVYYLLYQRNRPYQTVLPVLKKMVAHPEHAEVIMQASGQWEELYQTINLLSEQMSETYRAYATTEEQFQLLLHELMLGVFMIDEDNHLLLLNPKMQQYLGIRSYNKRQLYTEVFSDTQLIHLIHQVSPEKPSIRQEITLNETGQTLDVTLHVFENPSGVPQILGVANDLTRIRQLEKVQRDFVGNVSHELKTPVTSLMGFTETLLDGAKDDPETLTSFLMIMQQDAARLDKLIREIIQLSKDGETSYTPQVIVLNDLFLQLIQAYRPSITEKRLMIEQIGSPELSLYSQLELVQPIVKNLLENAIQYSSQDSRIVIRYTETNGEQLVISVQDFGIGIDQEDQERIFERFYRVDKARSRHSGGTGLGLAIVHDYVRLLGGTITVDSHPGLGSTFTVTLPKGAKVL